MKYIVEACEDENRFGYEEVAWLLIFGRLPTKNELEQFTRNLGANRELPQDFTEDMIMKAPSPDIMNKMARCVLALYSYDDNDNIVEEIRDTQYHNSSRHKSSLFCQKHEHKACRAQALSQLAGAALRGEAL